MVYFYQVEFKNGQPEKSRRQLPFTNNPPQLEPLPDFLIRPGDSIEFFLDASDPDDDRLLFSGNLSIIVFPGGPMWRKVTFDWIFMSPTG